MFLTELFLALFLTSLSSKKVYSDFLAPKKRLQILSKYPSLCNLTLGENKKQEIKFFSSVNISLTFSAIICRKTSKTLSLTAITHCIMPGKNILNMNTYNKPVTACFFFIFWKVFIYFCLLLTGFVLLYCSVFKVSKHDLKTIRVQRTQHPNRRWGKHNRITGYIYNH